jgi:o-succinylbenzoate---CoA ligase
MRVEPVSGDDPREVLRAVRAALNGSGPGVGLGMTEAVDAPAGTAVVAATSGSTGIPKRVMLARSALISSAMATAARVGEGAWLLALPAGYVAGLQVLVRSLVLGREPAMLSGRFSAPAFAAAAAGMASSRGGERVPVFTSLVPAQLTTLLDAGGTAVEALRSFEAVLIGGQRLAPPLRQRAVDAGVAVVRTYGSTETAGGCVYDGIPLGGVGVRVVDGELQLSGPTLADGYFGDAELTAEVFPVDADGTRWYRTGDAGAFDDGVVSVTGRIDNVIVSGGVNVSLDRVEQVVRTMAGLASAVVVGVPDARWGEASVVVTDAQDPSLDAVRAAVGEALGVAARPSRVVHVESIPMLASGKPDRAALRRMLR